MKPLSENRSDTPTTLVWDLPTRLFHWLLLALVLALVVTAKIGDDWMIWHQRCGQAVLILLVFRIVWGFIGSRHSRFTDFVRGPVAVLSAASDLFRPAVSGAKSRGHNPLGGYSVLLMLAALLTQAVTGLFSNDDATFEGPLANRVSKDLSDWFTHIHGINEVVIYILVGVHVAAIAFYWLVRKDNLVGPMITGHKPHGASETSAAAAQVTNSISLDSAPLSTKDRAQLNRRALGLLIVVAAIVLWMTRHQVL